MGAVTKVLKKSAVQVVNAAKTYADRSDGIADDWTDAHILAMLNTYLWKAFSRIRSWAS